MKPETLLLLVSGAMFLIGLLIIVFDGIKRRRCTEETTATVVSVQQSISTNEDGKKEYDYTPVFEFNAGGAVVRREGSISTTSRGKYKVGDIKQIRYDPSNPEKFMVVGGGGARSAGIVLIVLSVLLAGVTLYFGFIRK